MSLGVVLSAYWFAALVALGVFFPLFSLYLAEDLGLTGTEIGIVTAAIPLTGMVAQPLWGTLADRSGRRVLVLTAVSVGAAIGYACLGALGARAGLAGILAATVALAVWSTSVMPMAVSVSLAHLGRRGRFAFGAVRSMGTLGYLVAVATAPWLLRFGAGESAEPSLGAMLWIACAAMAVAAAISTRIPRSGAIALRAERGDWRRLASNGPFVRLVGVTFLIYVFLQGPLVLFPMFVRSLGGGLDVVSRMWLCMLALEIPLLALVGAVPARLGARGLIGIGVAADATRWLVSACSESTTTIYAVQVLHGLAVAGFVVGSAHYVEAVVPGRLRSTAQGVVYMVGVSLGSIVSSLVAGVLLDSLGPRAPALVGGGLAAALVVALPYLLPRVGEPGSADREEAAADLGALPAATANAAEARATAMINS